MENDLKDFIHKNKENMNDEMKEEYNNELLSYSSCKQNDYIFFFMKNENKIMENDMEGNLTTFKSG
jgi:hypothetical protein